MLAGKLAVSWTKESTDTLLAATFVPGATNWTVAPGWNPAPLSVRVMGTLLAWRTGLMLVKTRPGVVAWMLNDPGVTTVSA
jgi:hypothetical protein